MPKATIKHVKFTPEEMAYEAPAEVNFSKGFVIRGQAEWRKYLAARREFVRISPEVRKVFPDDKSVNEALKQLIKLANKTTGKWRSA